MPERLNVTPFQGYARERPATQGCALGWYVAPFQGDYGPNAGRASPCCVDVIRFLCEIV